MRPLWPLAALLLGLMLFLPLRLVLGGSGLAAGAVRGSFWSGELAQAQWHGLDLGDLALRLQPSALVTGRLRYGLAGDRLTGVIWQGSDAGASGLTGRLPLAGVTPLPLASLDLGDVAIAWRDGACSTASGSVRLLPAGLLAGLGPLAGQARCDGGRLLLPLASADGRATLSVTADGQGWRARLQVGGAEPAAVAALLAAGFAPGPAGPVLTSAGQW